MRAFIAIEMPAEVQAAIAALQAAARRAGAEVSWTRPENIHLTLKFLGEIETAASSLVERACREAAQAVSPFELRLSGTGVFPHLRAPRVLWVGLGGEIESARGLQTRLDEGLAAQGFPRAEREYRPHLTIGRFKSSRQSRELMALVGAHPLPALSFTVSEITFMRSELLPAGARYTALAKAPLCG